MRWAIPEGWIQAEMYAQLLDSATQNGWSPFPTEIPYATIFPVQTSPTIRRELKTKGFAVKWIDICAGSETGNQYCWLEMKVGPEFTHRYQRDATEFDGFRKDVVALMGFDPERTAHIWDTDDEPPKIYWKESVLAGHSIQLRTANHRHVAAFLKIGKQPDPHVWTEDKLLSSVRSWFGLRQKHLTNPPEYPGFHTEWFTRIADDCHLLVCDINTVRHGARTEA